MTLRAGESPDLMQLKITVPATSANLGPGFDAIGVALTLRNRFTFSDQGDGLTIDVQGEGAERIYRDERNLVVVAAERIFEIVGQRPQALSILIENDVPAASGMGSSSTAIIGGMLGANGLTGNQLSRSQILNLAAQLEEHPDNVMPALLGGLAVGVLEDGIVTGERFALPDYKVVIVLPKHDTMTKEARAILPQTVSLADAVANIGRTALLIQALQLRHFDKLRTAMQDRLHQPYRIPAIPGMEAAFAAAYEAGAAGVAMSGAGPSLIAFAANGHNAIADAAQAAFTTAGITSRKWILDVDTQGAIVC